MVGRGGRRRCGAYLCGGSRCGHSLDARGRAGARASLRDGVLSRRRAGTRHRPDDGFFAYAQAKAAADAHLRSTTLDWTVLGPGRLTLDPPSGRITRDPGSDADGGVSRANVAQVIAAALATPRSIGKTIGFIDGQTPIAQALSQLE
ncbi:hypothetical protein AO826_20315 [Xanthomonas phaseoli pv. manihotis]|nr:hypothetical protein AO826_20315 [Xanthomonas phaseoli pv. manihotis]